MSDVDKKTSHCTPLLEERGFRRKIRESREVLVVIGLIVFIFISFDTVLSCDFIELDDPWIVYNDTIHAGLIPGSIVSAFGMVHMGNWMPLTWISHMTDISLFGEEPFGHHLHNLILHILNVCLLFFFLREATGRVWLSAVAAILFGVHPLRVESVAWIAERKDVLSGAFGLAALWAYCCYGRRPGIFRYLLVVVLFSLGLMSKPMLVTWPFVFLLLDFWPLMRLQGFSALSLSWRQEPILKIRWQQSMLEKIPFFLLSFIQCVVTYLSQHDSGATAKWEYLPFLLRAENAVISYVLYLGKMFYPVRLAVLYPFHAPVSFSLFMCSLTVMIAVTIWVLCLLRKKPYLATGWFWYIGTLIPVIGLVQVGRQSMADRYTYLPSIGILIGIVWLAGQAEDRRPRLRIPLSICAVVAGVFLMFCTWGQTNYWKNSAALFERTLAVTTGNATIHQNYAVYLKSHRQFEDAVTHGREAIRLEPSDPFAAVFLGELFVEQNEPNEAIPLLEKALQSSYPMPEDALIYLGIAYLQKKNYITARNYLDQALARKPDSIPALSVLSEVFSAEKKMQEAIEVWKKILALDSSRIQTAIQLAWVQATSSNAELRDPPAALEYATQAARKTQYGSAVVLDVLAAAYAANGQYDAAEQTVQQAIETARRKKQEILVEAMEKRLALYQQHKPYQE